MTEHADVTIVGGGHNALVAATYLARAGLRTIVLERSDHTGGAAVSVEPFPGVRARLSRYSYLVSLFPEALAADLGLNLELRSRTTASYSPTLTGGAPGGLFVESAEGAATRDSFRALTGSDHEYEQWSHFYSEVAELAGAVAPTLLEPLPRAADLRSRAGADIWSAVAEQPLGEVIEERFADDLVRGVVATDALIGTFASLRDESLIQNRCFLYHLIGNGTGEWRVPVGGMGAVSGALAWAAARAGADLRTRHEVTTIEASESGALVSGQVDGSDFAVESDWVLCGAAPTVLDRLLGRTAGPTPEGSQLKINLLVGRLPRLRSGMDPRLAFAGTFHVAEAYSELERSYAEAAGGALPTHQPGELYCHTLTDPSILGDDLAASGAHTLTYFGVHTPPAVFEPDRAAARDEAVRRALAELDQHLEDPLEDCLLRDADGRPCIEAKTPLDIEEALAMPGGHIFHGDLAWPWLDETPDDDPDALWGVGTGHPRVLLCGSGARRGGAVSGIAGHNAAQAVLDFRRR